jgi:hypothetical protein
MQKTKTVDGVICITLDALQWPRCGVLSGDYRHDYPWRYVSRARRTHASPAAHRDMWNLYNTGSPLEQLLVDWMSLKIGLLTKGRPGAPF